MSKVKGKHSTHDGLDAVAVPARRRNGLDSAERDDTGQLLPYEPTPELRKLVANLAGIGTPQEEILHVVPTWGTKDGLPISLKTLHKYFRVELDRGLALHKVKARRMLSELIDEKHFGALVFYLKTQCGWKETVAVEATGKDGAALPGVAQMVVYLPAKDARPDEPAAG